MGVYVRLFGGMGPRKEEIAGQARDEEVWDGGCPLGGGCRSCKTRKEQSGGVRG